MGPDWHTDKKKHMYRSTVYNYHPWITWKILLFWGIYVKFQPQSVAIPSQGCHSPEA